MKNKKIDTITKLIETIANLEFYQKRHQYEAWAGAMFSTLFFFYKNPLSNIGSIPKYIKAALKDNSQDSLGLFVFCQIKLEELEVELRKGKNIRASLDANEIKFVTVLLDRINNANELDSYLVEDMHGKFKLKKMYYNYQHQGKLKDVEIVLDVIKKRNPFWWR